MPGTRLPEHGLPQQSATQHAGRSDPGVFGIHGAGRDWVLRALHAVHLRPAVPGVRGSQAEASVQEHVRRWGAVFPPFLDNAFNRGIAASAIQLSLAKEKTAIELLSNTPSLL